LNCVISNEISFSYFDALSPFTNKNNNKGEKMNQNLEKVI